VIALQGIIEKGKVQAGQSVLINGAGGGAGTFAVQLAKLYGAEVTGVDNAGKLDFLRSIGADHVIDYAREDFTSNGKQYDLILDVVAIGRHLLTRGRYGQMERIFVSEVLCLHFFRFCCWDTHQKNQQQECTCPGGSTQSKRLGRYH